MDMLDRGFIFTIVVQMFQPIESGIFMILAVKWMSGIGFYQKFFRYMPYLLYILAQVIVLMVGLVCYLRWVYRRTPRYRLVIWSWVLLEAGNAGLVIAWAASRINYAPGLLSSLTLVLALIILTDTMLMQGRSRRAIAS